jgi:hypothetical protein
MNGSHESATVLAGFQAPAHAKALLTTEGDFPMTTTAKTSIAPRTIGLALAAATVTAPVALALVAPAEIAAMAALVLPFVTMSWLEGRLPRVAAATAHA